MKIIIAMVALSIITGCASTQPTVIDYASDGTVLKMTSNMSGKQIAKLESVKAAELSNQAYYAAQQAKYSKLTDGRDVALVDAIAALSGNNGPTNYNDALIEQSKASVAKHQAWSKTLLGAGAIIGGASALKSLANAAGNKISVSDGSTYTDNSKSNEVDVSDESSYEGSQGDDSRSRTSDTTGSNNPSTTTTTTGETSTTEPTTPIDNEAACIAAGGEWVADEERCSDGMGGTL